ncbi:ABC transporter permease [Verminephrobacter aporrectodeae subsp. tuberculatae]|uniref:ABC transporter permease n=1 Tax=Verminephrobacter aporrectodeae subsp. tuberculatae TaxID=1110392 RepID=A0ABT3KQ47_9BURK|nr:ABC transporter permease [Verminephrobacter aporrectodeae]MCW5255066.1 ABC transporter permease [Verminephrobacter aporrectodeae subsp. tuberculatae]MCW5319910.1 ABC transporter permease [Verminephrobacter aporrectodeae subsp. tuberculatae]MCW8200393.1 ABC transporter permease [Verminephrobacter aporrectodeae subsp. tuberculatae]
MKLISFLSARLGKALFVILGVVVLNFLLIRLAPGDPASIMAGEAASSDPAYLAQLRQRFGLDQPLWLQLGLYVRGILQFDLGFSYRNNLPVLDLILERLPATLLLMALAFVFSLLAGGLLGVIAARSRYTGEHTWLDSLIMSVSLLLYATPLFWLSLLLIILFSVTLDWLPAFGMESVGAGFVGWARAKDIGAHLVLPVVSLGCFFMAVYARLTRASMLEVIGLDFVRTARAKGVPPGQVIRRHVLRNAMLPVLTFAGIQLGQMAGGALLTETVFGWPGIGRLMFDALMQRDYQLLLGVFLVTSTMVVLLNLITDLLYRLVDPRIESEN